MFVQRLGKARAQYLHKTGFRDRERNRSRDTLNHNQDLKKKITINNTSVKEYNTLVRPDRQA